jgi:hypothetical protein
MKRNELSRISVILTALLLSVALCLLSLPRPEPAYAAVDALIDGVFLVVDASLCGSEIINGESGLDSCLATGLDLVFIFIPFAVNFGSAAVKGLDIAGHYVDDAGDMVGAYQQSKNLDGMLKNGLSVIDDTADLRASKSLFGRYGLLKNITSGLGDYINAHHLNPQALADFFGADASDMLATIWSKRFHTQSKELDNITRRMNVLVDEVKAISGGNKYSFKGFTHYIGNVPDVYADAGKLYQGVVMLDALATPSGQRWLISMGVPWNILGHALDAASRDVMETTAVSADPARDIVAQALADAVYNGSNEAVCLKLKTALQGGLDDSCLGTDVTARFADQDVVIQSVETGQYLCGETDSTIHAGGVCEGDDRGQYHATLTADGWLGFQLQDGKWLSVQEKDYLRTEGLALSSWECFRIYQRGDDLFLLSQKNLRFVQVTNESSARPLKASRDASLGLDTAFWERFRIEMIHPDTAPDPNGTDSPTPSPERPKPTAAPTLKAVATPTCVPSPMGIPTSTPAPPTTPSASARVVDQAVGPDRYSGEWSNGQANGIGIYTWSLDGKWAGYWYEGSFMDGKMNGPGTMHAADGSRYEGTWIEDQVDGAVVHTLVDGTVYDQIWHLGSFVSEQWRPIDASLAGVRIYDLRLTTFRLPSNPDLQGLRIEWSCSTTDGILFAPLIEDIDEQGNVTSSYFFNDGHRSGFEYTEVGPGREYRVTVYALPLGKCAIGDAVARSQTISIVMPGSISGETGSGWIANPFG